MNDVHSFMAMLAEQRPLFHSEADFQHALAWLLHEKWPKAKIRLEYPVSHDSKNRYLDIFVQNGDELLAIELKYKTAEVAVEIDGEQFQLKNQSAQDLGRKAFVRDIKRLEEFVKDKGENARGWVILLTNASGYWNKGRKYTNDADYRLDDGRQLKGTLQWYRDAKNKVPYEGEEPTELCGIYTLNWCDYPASPKSQYNGLRYLGLEIKP